MMKNITKNNKLPFQLFYLKNDDNQPIEAVEVNEINLEEIKKHLEQGESVHIACKRPEKRDVNFIAYEELKEPWYFVRS